MRMERRGARYYDLIKSYISQTQCWIRRCILGPMKEKFAYFTLETRMGPKDSKFIIVTKSRMREIRTYGSEGSYLFHLLVKE